ncbi:conserved hypothetical protein [Histoplasma capsulatum G186AR]|uniref:FAM192A/Fyv6 N-terminal domain-containing protein n=2 Tax=Ajellomyces capsulatus TaxID=5037 RepID=C0NJG2_AJECG|nr:uncharacterized protein HCBG_03292 [Histoplasma capsulatum G186AR]EEH08003.1 conserved hypothetical protein [Histoplasma capsulatum G186AR]KAG5299675.1 NEFA-interacting nuclear protein NIP30, nitrosative stress-induced transcript [Histoplasma capsulatum]QSS67699.1 NEFA-interacting nuclear protein NIP30, nitrosative stress-induced transcript [Histoplasma capsulatum G186AR]
MSSGFVSGGTIEEPTERDDEWLRAQQELEAERRRKVEESQQDKGKSLYEILQQNKAAKQEAFEESIKLKNQFRSLDEDEVEFLDSILESTRAQDAALKRETREQLEIFHRQRQEAEKALIGTGSGDLNSGEATLTADEEQWTISGRKRRRAKEKDAIPGVKLRKSSSAGVSSIAASKESRLTSNSAEMSKSLQNPDISVSPRSATKPESTDKPGRPTATSAKVIDHSRETKEDAVPHVVSSALGLGAYSSEDD